MIIVKTNDGKIKRKIGDGVKKFSELPYDEITIDSATSETSTNPVQNKVITAVLDGKAGTAVATKSANGLMSAADKEKLDGIAVGANKTDVDSSLSGESIRPVQNRVITTALANKAGTAEATTKMKGLMSASDKTKLDGIATGANKIIVDTALSNSSTNPVQNKVITVALANKAGVAEATSKAKGLMSALDKAKMDSLDYGATKIVVDSKLSAGSKNPVENYIIKAALDNLENSKLSKSGGTLTGNVNGKYFCGTWLQTTEASDLGRTSGKIAVLDDSGWVYYRTPSELFADLGITNAIKSYVDTAIVVAINSSY